MAILWDLLPSQNDKYFFDYIGIPLGKYDKFLLTGDFNAQVGEPGMILFCKIMMQKINKSIRLKNIENPSCVDLFITNSVNSYQHTKLICSGLSDCHKIVIIVLKTAFQKSKPCEITYRDYSKYNEEILGII